MRLHVTANAAAATVEARPRNSRDAWRPLCGVPCDLAIDPLPIELRVAGVGVQPSNPFRIEGERGAARLHADAGRAASHRLGERLFLVGLPVALAGGATLGVAQATDGPPAVSAAGVAAIALGLTAVVASLPLVVSGTTRVQDDAGKTIGAAWFPAAF